MKPVVTSIVAHRLSPAIPDQERTIEIVGTLELTRATTKAKADSDRTAAMIDLLRHDQEFYRQSIISRFVALASRLNEGEILRFSIIQTSAK